MGSIKATPPYIYSGSALHCSGRFASELLRQLPLLRHMPSSARQPVRPDHPLDILSSPPLLRPNRRLPTLEDTEDPFSRAKRIQSSEAGHIITADRRNQIDKSMATALQKRYDDEMEVYALFMGALQSASKHVNGETQTALVNAALENLRKSRLPLLRKKFCQPPQLLA
ncbi:hypothetical protein NHJ6243_008973 [Beauveria neobassiana]